MEAIICDRCGKKTSKFQGTRLKRNVFIGGFDIIYDLCPDCADKFHKFMNPHDFPEDTETEVAQ